MEFELYPFADDKSRFMIKVPITEEMRERARQHAMQDKAIYGSYNSYSFADDKTRYVGSLGEEVVNTYYKTPLVNKTDYDIILNNERVEVKSQGLNASETRVKVTYEVHSLKLCVDCDKYMFVFVHNSHEYGLIVGRINMEKFNSTCRREPYKDGLEYITTISELEEL